MYEEPIDEELVEEFNDMVDKMEDGSITKREFFRYLAGLGVLLAGVAPLIRASGRTLPQRRVEDLLRTGVLLRVREQQGALAGTLQGRVNPGAVGYSQVDTQGMWNFSITEGLAQLKIGDRLVQLKEGETVSANPYEGISFLNPGHQPWFFEAHYWPNWHPDAIHYEYGGRQVPGKEAWFELKTHEEDTVRRPLYHVYGWNSTPATAGYMKQNSFLKAKGIGVNPRPVPGVASPQDYSGYSCGVEVCDYSLANQYYVARMFGPQDVSTENRNTSRRSLFSHGRRTSLQNTQGANYTFAEYNDLDYRIITALSGAGQVEINGEAHRMQRGDSVTIAPGDRQKVINDGGKVPFLVEIRAQNPTYWHPDRSFVELSKGNFSKGHDVWFELVLPL